MTDDGRLLEQWKRQGSQAAFSALVTRHLDFVYSVCLRETQDAALAEDVTQVVFLLLSRKAPSFGPDTRLTGWLFQTARFACKNALRRDASRRRLEQNVGEQMLTESPGQDALWEQVAPHLNAALASLGTKDHEAVLLRFADGLSFAELGTALGTSEDAARMRLNRALTRLRGFFAKQGVSITALVLTGLLADRTTQAAPASCITTLGKLGASALSPQVSIQLQGALKTMIHNKLKFAAAISIGAVLAGSLPFVTLVQARKFAKPAPRRPLSKARTTANMSALPAASKPTPPTVPKSLHVVYTILSKSENYPPVVADYWVAAPDSARWTWNGRYPTTIMTDGQTWMSLMEPPNAASVIKTDAAPVKANPAPNQTNLVIERAHSWNDATLSIYGPGVLAGEIPFLGFGQPGKIYRQGRVKVVKTASGWTEHCQIPHGYFRDATTGKPGLVEAMLTYDRQGRLVRFRRNHAGDIWKNTTFSGFIEKGGLEIPGQIRDWETDETGGRVVIDTEITYRIRSLDTTPAVPGWFSVQHQPQGATIQDSRFSLPPKGAADHSEDIY